MPFYRSQPLAIPNAQTHLPPEGVVRVRSWDAERSILKYDEWVTR